MIFQKLLKKYREQRGYTKTSLADKVGVSQTYITHMESGQRTPPPQDTCKKISDVLSLTTSERKEFFEAAYIERNKGRDPEYLAALRGYNYHDSVIRDL